MLSMTEKNSLKFKSLKSHFSVFNFYFIYITIKTEQRRKTNGY
jgi:hypothetical protein